MAPGIGGFFTDTITVSDTVYPPRTLPVLFPIFLRKHTAQNAQSVSQLVPEGAGAPTQTLLLLEGGT